MHAHGFFCTGLFSMEQESSSSCAWMCREHVKGTLDEDSPSVGKLRPREAMQHSQMTAYALRFNSMVSKAVRH